MITIDNKRIRNRTVGFYKTDYTKWVRVEFSDIMYIDTLSKMPCRIVFFNDKFVYSHEPLIKISNFLPFKFERIHRTCVVNVEYIDYVDYRRKLVVLKNEVQLSLGLSYIENLKKYFV